MMELREKISGIIADEYNDAAMERFMVRSRRLKIADAILALPEIKEAPPLHSQLDVIAKTLAHKGRMDDVRVLHQAAEIIEGITT